MNLSLGKEKSHEAHREHLIHSGTKEAQPEEFDLVILGGGTGSTVGRVAHL